MRKSRLLTSLSIIFFFVGLFSCNEENINPSRNIESNIQHEEDISSSRSIESSAQLLTTCDIIGISCVSSGSTVTYTYSSNFTPNDVNWSIQTGSISILNGQGTNNIILEFGSGFNGGSIFAIGSGSGGIVCSTSFAISKCTPRCTPPASIHISQISGSCQGDIFTFSADPDGSTDNGTYQWSSFQGASIISGQGTPIIQVQSPLSGGFSISVTHINSCQNKQVISFTLAEFSAGCGGF